MAYAIERIGGKSGTGYRATKHLVGKMHNKPANRASVLLWFLSFLGLAIQRALGLSRCHVGTVPSFGRASG
jgi:hypothetical protein